MSLLQARPGPPGVTAGIRWHYSESGFDLLQSASLDLDALVQSGRATLVKQNLFRRVYQADLGDVRVYWKQCRITTPRTWLRQCIRAPKAKLEFDRALELARRGIGTIEPLAWGSRRGLIGDSYLITRELTNAVPLSDLLNQPLKSSERRDLARQLGNFLARVHQAGAVHPDLHPGNILVTHVAGGAFRFHLIDLHDITLGEPLDYAVSRDNLVILNRWFMLRSNRTDRLRFWRSYAAHRGWKVATAEREIEDRTRLSNLEFWRRRETRCLGTNRYFQKVLSPAVRGFAVRDVEGDLLAGLAADPDFPFRDPTSRMLKNSATSTVIEMVVATQDGSRTFIYKRFNLKKWFAATANFYRSSAARRSWRLGHTLRDRDLPTPRPIVMLHRRGWLGPREGYLLCEKIEAVSLTEAVEKATHQERGDLIDRLGRLLRRFHESGLKHRDLKAANLLVNDSGIHFIDLVGVSRHSKVPFLRRVRDLARLNGSFHQSTQLSQTDKLRFLRAYLQWSLQGSEGWKAWWTALAAATREKIARNQRTGRPLA